MDFSQEKVDKSFCAPLRIIPTTETIKFDVEESEILPSPPRRRCNCIGVCHSVHDVFPDGEFQRT